ncbi:hypothetical protein BDR26DRAFT_1007413 [Obelidium mucronatum]|nr:hypothetical protein BDR26DRAFT_1007413 [Obelidium mucronatum]
MATGYSLETASAQAPVPLVLAAGFIFPLPAVAVAEVPGVGEILEAASALVPTTLLLAAGFIFPVHTVAIAEAPGKELVPQFEGISAITALKLSPGSFIVVGSCSKRSHESHQSPGKNYKMGKALIIGRTSLIMARGGVFSSYRASATISTTFKPILAILDLLLRPPPPGNLYGQVF